MKKERDVLGLGPEDLGLKTNGQSQDPALPMRPELTSWSEVLDPASVEVRIGNPDVDAPRLLELFTQETTIEHLADITPRTTVDEIRRLYRGAKAQRPVLLTAETPSGIIVGTYTLQRPVSGSNAAEGMRLAVDEKFRRKGIASKLVKAGNAVMFREGEGGFDSRLSQIYVIIGVPSYHTAQDVFSREGYLRQTEREQATRSWSNELGELVDRNSQPMTLTRRSYRDLFPEAHIKYFPTLRPPKVA